MRVVNETRFNAAKEAPLFAKKAWYCLRYDAFPRKQCIAIVSRPLFDNTILVLIALNCITMMVFNEPVLLKMIEEYPEDFAKRSDWAAADRNADFFQPLGSQCSITGRGPCSISQWIDWAFLIIFTMEALFKLLASGLWMHPNAYLRSGWNRLDIIVVVTGFIDMYGGAIPGMSTLRLFRALRPLRSVQKIRGMRVLVSCIIEALPQMCNVLVFLMFVIFFFALVGVALFKSGLRYSCHTTSDNITWASTGDICRPHCTWTDGTVRLDGSCLSLGPNTFQKQSYHDPVHWTYSCRLGQECRCTINGLVDATCSAYSNPNMGITNFDSLPWAAVSLFQAISLEGWVDMMYQLMDGVSSWVWAYFILLVFFGSIIVINLFLAVLCDNFEMADGEDRANNPDDDNGEQAAKEIAREYKQLVHKNPLRQAILNLIKHRTFDISVQCCIIINTLLMTIKWSPQPWSTRVVSIPTNWVSTDYMPPTLFWILFYLNIVLTAIFLLESVLKIIGFGPRLFVMNRMNDFDFFVVLVSIFEIFVDVYGRLSGDSFYFPLPLSVLRAFRIFRLFKLAKGIPSIRKILATLLQSMGSVMYLALLLVLMILIFVLMGMQLIGGTYPRPELGYTAENFPLVWQNKRITAEDASRYHFDDPGNACLAIFVVLSGENWNEIMFDSHAATWVGDTSVTPPIPFAIIYFLILFVVGNLLLFNLFIAILLSNFDDDEEEVEDVLDKGSPDYVLKPAKASTDEPTMEWKFNAYVARDADGNSIAHPGGTKGSTATASTRTTEPASTSGSADADGAAAEEEEEFNPKAAPLFPMNTSDVSETGGDKAMNLFGWGNPVRIFAARVVTHSLFENFIFILILVSTAMMLADMPHLSAKNTLRVFIGWCNFAFAYIFLLEMLLKWIACGVVQSKTPTKYQLGHAYFRGPAAGWNFLDFFIVVISILVTFNIKSLNPLRVARALRPLRLVSRYEDLKVTVATLFQSVPEMGSLISVCSLFFLIFAILGTELYGGKLGYCADPEYEDMPFGSRVIPGMNRTQTDYEECMSLPRYNITRITTHGILFTDMADMFPDEPWISFTEFPQWFYPQFGYFDNLKLSLFLLFEVSALEGWPDVMHWCMDSDANAQFVIPWPVSSDQGGGMGGVESPVGANVHTVQSGITAVFFIAWIILGCFVVVNMTVGVVVDTFARIKAENEGLLLMSEDAADWVKAQKQVFAQRPLVLAPPPQQAWRLNVYYLVTSTRFEIFIMLAILGNMLQMGIDFWEPAVHEATTFHSGTETLWWSEAAAGDPNFPQITQVKAAMMVCNIIFLVIYICEMLVKWIGIGTRQYFKSTTDCFDFVLVTISTVEVIASLLHLNLPVGFMRVLRLFRVVRILRVFKSAKSLRTVIMTVILSIPQLKNILVLIVLIIIIADVLCVDRFSFVNYTPGNHDPSPDHLISLGRGELLPDPDNYFYYGADGTNWGDQINRHANFQFWWVGFLTLVRSSTGESFNGIIHDLFDWQWGNNRLKCCPECGPMLDGDEVTYTIVRDPLTGNIIPGATTTLVKPESSCGATGWAVVIYLLFQLIMAYIVLSIMIGVILENFTNVGSETRKIQMDDLEDFREVWLKYDPKGTFVVPSHNLLAILQQLRQPLGIAGAQPALTRAEMLKHLGRLDIPDHNGQIHFMETLTAIAHHHAGVPVPVCDTTRKMQKAAQNVPKLRALEKPAHNALTNYLVSLLQSRWRSYAMRKKYDGGNELPPAYATAPPAIKKSKIAPLPPRNDDERDA